MNSMARIKGAYAEEKQMTGFMNGFEQMLNVVIEFSIHLLEFMGVATILVGAVRAVYELFRHNPGVRLKLAESMALALEFKLGGEILRTVQVRDWSEIAIVGAIILLRGVLNLLIHHEIRVEEERDERLKHMSEPEHGGHGDDVHTIHGCVESSCVFPTPDMDKTAEWYSRCLGFRAERYLNDSEPHICLYREDIEIILTDSNGAPVRTNRDLYGSGCDGFFATDAVEALQREFMAKGARIPKPLENSKGGNYGFVVEDMDGRYLDFVRKEN